MFLIFALSDFHYQTLMTLLTQLLLLLIMIHLRKEEKVNGASLSSPLNMSPLESEFQATTYYL